MASYAGGTKVGGGTYWKPGSWRVQMVPAEGATLQGESADRYVRVPFPVLLALTPVVGGLFVVLFPVAGFGLFAYGLARRVVSGASRGAAELASAVRPGMVAGEAHLTGAPGEKERKAGDAEGAPPRAIEELEKEVSGRREK
ncbi:MAG TPA: hypothetical protein VLS93_18640 [Anaeromyxobacteraceae bacterium]|nr:hypothetical protein [Anaeromyxobacteraceae bacterium]